MIILPLANNYYNDVHTTLLQHGQWSIKEHIVQYAYKYVCLQVCMYECMPSAKSIPLLCMMCGHDNTLLQKQKTPDCTWLSFTLKNVLDFQVGMTWELSHIQQRVLLTLVTSRVSILKVLIMSERLTRYYNMI